MKRITYAFATLLFVLPSVSSAAALTQQQSTSLIAVVQSSPGTPASVFVPLITAFSNITVSQATSLITVVQSAPGVPANAFVDLLTSFTVDTPATQSTDTVSNTATITATTQQIQCSPTYPTAQNLMITDVAPPHINFSVLTYTWKTTKYFATTTNSIGFALYGSVSLWNNELVTDIQNCSRMNLIMQSGSTASIEYFIDGMSIGKPSSVGLGDYQMPFDTKKYTDGEHTLSITATDADEHTASASTQIYIKN